MHATFFLKKNIDTYTQSVYKAASLVGTDKLSVNWSLKIEEKKVR